MPYSLRLDDARSQVIFLAAIDGKTGANGRFSTTNLNLLLNRKYRALRAAAADAGSPQFTQSTSPASIPSPTGGEDFSLISMPALTQEVMGVDVKTSNSSKWGKLDGIEFGQRRSVGSMCAPHGVGWWSVVSAPSAVAASSITAGGIALWANDFPCPLSGQYVLVTADAWTNITTDAHVFVMYDGWEDWLLNACVMACCQRDKNKSDIYLSALEAWKIADAQVSRTANRLQRSGGAPKTPYGGIVL